MTEKWRPVVGYEGLYEVSDQGRVRSVDRYVMRYGGKASGRPVHVRERIKRLTPAKCGGYPTVSLGRDGGQRSWTVHRLIMEAFVGPLPEGMEILHCDGNPANCQLNNLRYGTSSENKRDTIRHGRDRNLQKTHCAQGHPYDEVNTYVMPKGGRDCRTCTRDRHRRMRLRASENRRIRTVGILQDGV